MFLYVDFNINFVFRIHINEGYSNKTIIYYRNKSSCFNEKIIVKSIQNMNFY